MVAAGVDENGKSLLVAPVARASPVRKTGLMRVPPQPPQVDLALLAAVSAGHMQVVEQLIAAGANADGDGAALRSASANGHPEVVRVLLNASADPDEFEVLLVACGCGRLSVVQLLLERGVDLHAAHDAALREACARGHADIAQFLIDHGANVHAHDDEAIQEASANGHAHIVQLLLQHGAVQPSVSRG
jgi:ankyrin repeat protein